jgi:catechol 2,3-dioxygenase-like lactoylglutathione lyase family enzyme
MEVTTMDVKLQNSFLKVDDPDKAIAFYRDALGFDVRGDVGYDGLRWVTVGPPSQPDVSIVLEPPVADPGTSPADRIAMSRWTRTGASATLPFAIRPATSYESGGRGADNPEPITYVVEAIRALMVTGFD